MPAITHDLDRFYALLACLADAPNQGRVLRELPNPPLMPRRGVYFFTEPGELRSAHRHIPRIVRVGTHAVSTGAQTTLRQRLKAHLGTEAGGGNHRGSIFRSHIGTALLQRDNVSLPTWGIGRSATAETRKSEADWEQRVSRYLGAESVLWIDVPDEPSKHCDRAFIERNAIALLSNHLSPIDKPSDNWLGRFSLKHLIPKSGLWNLKHVDEDYDPAFLDKLESFVTLTCHATAS